MTTSSVLRAANPDHLRAYLTSLQETAFQLEALLEAVSALIFDNHRNEMAAGILDGALKIAGELSTALDTVTIGKELAGGVAASS